jgi:hypothetical protein
MREKQHLRRPLFQVMDVWDKLCAKEHQRLPFWNQVYIRPQNRIPANRVPIAVSDQHPFLEIAEI